MDQEELTQLGEFVLWLLRWTAVWLWLGIMIEALAGQMDG